MNLSADGIDHATKPVIRHGHLPYAFSGQNYSLSCSVEKAQSSHIFIKWHLVNQSCYEVCVTGQIPLGIYYCISQFDTSTLMETEDVEIIPLHKGKDFMRLNMTLSRIPSHLDGAILECIISDVSLDSKSSRLQLKVYGNLFL